MANIDLTQFHEVFFEESLEGLEAMESGLLGLDTSAPDPEIINTMFRAAHSIKGGAGTFGFNDISEFTHVVESILDDVRNQAREVTDGLIQLLFESVDFMKQMLILAKSARSVAPEEIAAFVDRLNNPVEPDPTTTAGAPDDGGEISTWQITITPRPELFISGHDPYRLARELSTMGEVAVIADFSALPEFDDHIAEHCYLEWVYSLTGPVTREQIESVFEWIDDEAEIVLEKLAGEHEQDQEQAPENQQEDRVAEPARTGQSAALQNAPEATSIRVNLDRVDHLVNLVGELVITQSMLSRFKEGIEGTDIPDLIRGIEQLEENTRELQEHTMMIRMLPIESVFQRLPRLVRDVGRSLGKDIELAITGNQTEVDKTVLEKIGDPLMHLVRNSLDHGIEAEAQRRAAGKNLRGRIEITAYHEGGSIVIEVADDGAGLDKERILARAVEKGIVEPDAELSDAHIHNLIFAPGLSTAAEVSDVSGRGVGMDVVKNNIEQLNGNIRVQTEPGAGTRFVIRLPLTLSIIEGQLIRVGTDIFIIPLLSIIESTRINPSLYGEVAGNSRMYRIQGDYIRIVRLDEIYRIDSDYADVRDAIMVVVNAQEKFGILVDEVLGQQQVVVKSLETNFKLIPTVSGATILGDGTIAMILDVAGLFRDAVQTTQIDGG